MIRLDSTYLVVLLFYLLWQCSPARSHDWFIGLADPVTKTSCCGKGDCKEMPGIWQDLGVIKAVPGGFHVRLTVQQAQWFNPFRKRPVNAFIARNRMQYGQGETYSLCIRAASIDGPIEQGIICAFGPGAS